MAFVRLIVGTGCEPRKHRWVGVCGLYLCTLPDLVRVGTDCQGGFLLSFDRCGVQRVAVALEIGLHGIHLNKFRSLDARWRMM